MTPATLEIVERLAREAGFTPSEFGLSPRLVGDLARFRSLAMEHAAGICEANATRWATAEECADAIREAGK